MDRGEEGAWQQNLGRYAAAVAQQAVSAAGVACGTRLLTLDFISHEPLRWFAWLTMRVCTGWKDNFLMSGSGWAAVMIAVAGLVNILYLFTRSDPVYPLVYIWACAAIFTGHRTHNCNITTACVTLFSRNCLLVGLTGSWMLWTWCMQVMTQS